MKKKCEICGVKFETHRKNAKYCSDACRKEANRKNNAEKNKSPYEKKEERRLDHLAEINQRAREAGMSYGKYVGMLYLEEMKRRRR